MLCEVCGERLAEVRARIETSLLHVCGQCASLGQEVLGPSRKLQEVQQSYVAAEPGQEQAEEVLVENYGAKLRSARVAVNMTQEEFAAKLNVSLPILRAAEAGKRLDLQTAKKLEGALKIKLVEKFAS